MVYVVERLGSYSDTWSAGLHVKIPFIERIAKKVSLKEQVADFPPQPVITRDNVTMQIDTVVFFQVMDAKLYTYGVNQPIAAIESLSATTLRNIIGEMELDHTLTSRDVINGKITAILDEATDKWGIKVNRVEVKNIIPPREIQEAMEKQMKAEREKRAVILKADGEKQAAITAAEGEKESAILRADAVKQQRILEAEGEAQAILAVQKANADAIRLLNEAMPNDKVLASAQSGSTGQGRQRQGHQDHHPVRAAESGRRRAQHQGADDRPRRCRNKSSPMIYDTLNNLPNYLGVSDNLDSVIEFIMARDINNLPAGRTRIDGDKAVVTVSTVTPQSSRQGPLPAPRQPPDPRDRPRGQRAV